MRTLESTFLISLLLLAYTYIGYPLLIKIWAWIRNRTNHRESCSPTVSILVVAWNEAAGICQRIENLLALDYDGEKLEIVVASDGSTDDTAALASRYRAAGVRVASFRERRGKPSVLNDLVPQLSGEIVVLMDVRQRIDPDALRMLLRNFADPAVGAVSGELILTRRIEDERALEGVGFYWRYEKFIRLNESRVDSAVGATGALYALRRRLFELIPSDTVLDDVLIPMQIVRQGYRVLFEPEARAREQLGTESATEFRRKVRTIAGNYQLFFRQPWLLNPLANRLWFQTVSHKFFRLLGPALLVTLLASNLLLLDSTVFQILLLLQLLFYLAAWLGHLFPDFAKRHIFVSVPQAFCLLNWSAAVGFYRFITRRQQITWAQARDPQPSEKGVNI